MQFCQISGTFLYEVVSFKFHLIEVVIINKSEYASVYHIYADVYLSFTEVICGCCPDIAYSVAPLCGVRHLLLHTQCNNCYQLVKCLTYLNFK